MRPALQTLFLFILALIPASIVHADEKAFFDDNVSYAATRYEDYLQSKWSAEGRTVEEWMGLGQTALAAGDAEGASRDFASAAVKDKKNADAWAGLARAYLIMKPVKPGDAYRFLETATSAAYLSYKRATSGPAEADALALLGEALTRRQYWRPALNAYRASLDLRESAELRKTYEQLKAERGFRLLDYKVDSDAKDPRVCAQFSEPLSRDKIDFSKFVTVNGKDPSAVTKENYQLCVGGLTHGERYEIAIRQGLPSTVREDLSKTANLTIYVRDRSPFVRFTGRNYVLPKTGQNGIPIVSVNTKEIELEIYRIGDRALTGSVLDGNFAEQINEYRANEIANKKGQKVWTGNMPVEQVLNEEVTTAFPVDEALPKLDAGLYVVVASAKDGKNEGWKAKATQWFIVSDMGLAAFSGADGIHGFVRSLDAADPLQNVELRLLARNNEVLATAKTDENGHVHFAPGLTRGTGGEAPAVLIAERPGTDYAFLDLTTSSFDLSDRGVGGRQTPGPLDAYMFAERGVYRPGEQVHLTALLRDNNAKAVENLPLTLVYSRPDGVEYQRATLKDQGFGGRTHDLTLQTTAMTGTWRAQIYADPKGPAIGDTSFLVEDYVPERMEMKLVTDETPLASGGIAKIELDGRYLYGAPASNLTLDGQLTITPDKGNIKGFEGYKFGVPDENLTAITRPLFKLPRTDKDGKATIEAEIPSLPDTTQNLKASVTVHLQDPGGRAISKTVLLKIKPAKPVIGIKPLFEANQTGEGQNAIFDVVSLDENLKPTDLKGLKWELLEIHRDFQWYSHNGSWQYEPVTYTNRIANGDVDLTDGKPFRIDNPVNYGRYRLEISSATSDEPSAEYEFTAGWFAADAADTPDILDMALDKQSYKPGDTATLTLSPRTDGKAVISVLSDRLITQKMLDVKKGDNTVTLTIGDDWLPGAYVTATVYRPMDTQARRMPSRAIGIKWLSLNEPDNHLFVELGAPEKSRPNEKLTIPVKVGGLKAGTKARLTLAAVDVGILNLTKYEAPKPTGWYYGQRRLGTEIRDLYGRLIDGMEAVRGRIRSGGDAAGLAMDSSPPAQKPVALFSGLVDVAQDGTAEVNFDIPAFDGTLRLMAVAWNGTQLGETQKDIIIRDPVVLSATTPRFLTAGDDSQLFLTIDNVEGPAGDYALDVNYEGPLSADAAKKENTIALNEGERKSLSLPFKASSIGNAKVSLLISGPDGYQAERVYEIPVFPAAPDVKRRLISNLTATGGKLTISKDSYDGLIPSSVNVAVNVGPGAALDVPGLLLALDRYPHGCAEQITSRALPLLYLSSLAEKSGVAGDKGAKERVQKAIDRLAELQDSSGAFGLWRPAGGDLWLTAYITDFLTRAKEGGYVVKAQTFNQALDRLANFINYAPDFSAGGQDVAYALYVLARNSRASIGDLRYYADTKLEKFSSALARAQLGAALALYGDKPRSSSAFRSALAKIEPKQDEKQIAYRSDYGTSLRDGAAALTLISETGVERQKIPNLTSVLESLRSSRDHTTTQENAWLLLAANALLKEDQPVSLAVNGKAWSGPLQKVLTAEDFANGDYVVTNNGDAALTAAVTVRGASLEPEPAAAKGFKLERNYYKLDGTPADLSAVKQNDRLVAVVKVTEEEAKRGRLILVDRLPAGFEIENPRLVSGTEIKSLSWITGTISPAHTEFRDDKFVAAFNLGKSGAKAKPSSATLAYIVRAVVPGTYVHPAATIEDMYRPDRFAQTGGGTVVVNTPSR